MTRFLTAWIVALLLLWPAVAADKGKAVSDDALYDLVRRRLASDAVVKGGGLQVDVKQGVVTLRGKIETEKQKVRAEKLAKKVRGVTGVKNELQVGHR